MKTKAITFKYALIHSVYWILITGFFMYEKRYLIYKASMPYFAVCVAGRIALLVLIAYLNVQYFLPRYLLKKRYRHYIFAVLLSVLGYLIAQSLFDFYLYGYVIGPLRNSDLTSALSYNFFSTFWYLGFMLALKLSMDWYEQQVVIQKITVERLNAEVDFLRTQINPHFLFNVLNNLYALTLKKSELAPDVVLKLSEMMEYMLYDSSDPKVLLSREIAYLQNYMELEKLRVDGSADIALVVNTAPENEEIAPFLLLPLVENAFKHGLSKLSKNGWLKVTIELQQSELTILVENNKPPATGAGNKGGIGQRNLQKRLELLYPGRHQLTLEDKGDLFLARLTITLQ